VNRRIRKRRRKRDEEEEEKKRNSNCADVEGHVNQRRIFDHQGNNRVQMVDIFSV